MNIPLASLLCPHYTKINLLVPKVAQKCIWCRAGWTGPALQQVSSLSRHNCMGQFYSWDEGHWFLALRHEWDWDIQIYVPHMSHELHHYSFSLLAISEPFRGTVVISNVTYEAPLYLTYNCFLHFFPEGNTWKTFCRQSWNKVLLIQKPCG